MCQYQSNRLELDTMRPSASILSFSLTIYEQKIKRIWPYRYDWNDLGQRSLIQFAPGQSPAAWNRNIMTRKTSQVTDHWGQDHYIFRESVKLSESTVLKAFIAIHRFLRKFTKNRAGASVSSPPPPLQMQGLKRRHKSGSRSVDSVMVKSSFVVKSNFPDSPYSRCVTAWYVAYHTPA